MNVIDWIILLVIAFLMAAAVCIVCRNKKKGRTCCGEICSHCMQDCHGKGSGF